MELQEKLLRLVEIYRKEKAEIKEKREDLDDLEAVCFENFLLECEKAHEEHDSQPWSVKHYLNLLKFWS